MSNPIATITIRNNLAQFLRYSTVGLICNLSGYFLFILITHYDVKPKLAMTLLYVLGTSLSFLANWQWVFNSNQIFVHASSRFFLAHLLGYLINLTLLIIFVDRLGYHYQFVQAAGIIVVAAFLFLTFKFYVFSAHLSKIRD